MDSPGPPLSGARAELAAVATPDGSIYAIGGGGESVNFFAVVEYPKVWPHGDKWLDPIEPGEALQAFAGWHPAVAEMVLRGSGRNL